MAMTAMAATGKVDEWVVVAEEVEDGTTWGAAVAVLAATEAAEADEADRVTEAANQ